MLGSRKECHDAKSSMTDDENWRWGAGLAPFDEFLRHGDVALVSCCNVGHEDSRYSVAVVTAKGIDWLDLDAAIDPARDKGVTGIAASSEHCFLAVPGANERLISLDSRLRLVDVFTCERGRDIHSLAVHDGRLYFAATGCNQVLSVGCTGGKFSGPEEVHVTCQSPAEDLVHLNSLLIDEKGALLFSMFGVGPRSQMRNQGAVVDVHSGEALVEGLMDPHSLTRLPDGRIAMCESMQSALCIVDPTTCLVTRVALRGYTRGIAHTGRHLVVGASHWRSRSRSSSTQVRGLPSFESSAQQNHSAHSYLFVLREDLSVANTIDFTPYASEIYDVAFLGRSFQPASVFKQAVERRKQVQRSRWPRGLMQVLRA
jgi:uncharacterized protein (TIGR03032 family)